MMEAVKERVRNELKSDPHVGHLSIRVEYAEGFIILEGNVQSYYCLQMAQEAAKRVVDNRSRNGNGIPYLALSIRNNLSVS
jgi:hypothetical protein